MASEPLFWVAALACLVVLGVLLRGVSKFAKSDQESRIKSNKLMQWRLIAQFVAVVIIMIFVYVTRSGGQ